MGCRISREGYKTGKNLAKKYYPQRKLLYNGHRHNGEPSKIGHHFKYQIIQKFKKSV